MKKLKYKQSKVIFSLTVLAVTACTKAPTATPPLATIKEQSVPDILGSCLLPPLAVNVGVLLGPDWGTNSPGAFPFTQGGTESEPGYVALSLKLNFRVSIGALSLISVTGDTSSKDKVFLPALVNRPVKYGPPLGGYTATPDNYSTTGCDSIWR